MDGFSLTLVIIGALNWLLVALFQFDAVAWLCAGSYTVWARIIYGIVGICGIWCVRLLFDRSHGRERAPDLRHET
jgi:uncharacterized protein